MNNQKISAVINTYNAESSLEKTLRSLQTLDEIVVCDMESTDKTIEIAKRYNCKIVVFPRGEYNICEPARNTAIQAASNEWVLIVDADETVSPQLIAYLYARIAQAECPEALYIPRKNYLLNHTDHYTYPDYQCRFVRKSCTDWPPTIHSKPRINGRTEFIPAQRKELALNHAPESMSSYFSKICRYTDNEMERRQGEHITFWKLIFKPAFRFFKNYFLKGGIWRGKVGYIQSKYQSIYKFVLMCKLYENELNDTEEYADPKAK